MQILKILIGSFAFMGTVTLAVAAEPPVANLFEANGKILVDQGNGFVASTGQTLKVGDRVFVGDKSSAVLAYATCSVKLDRPTVYVVRKIAPCAEVGSVINSPAGGGLSPVALVGLPVVVGGGLLLLTSSQTVSKP